jgi:hypothetical protein
MKKIPPELRLERIVLALSEDVTQASDAEILAACADLGIQPAMKGSIAFLGLKKGLAFFPYVPEKLPPLTDAAAGLNGSGASRDPTGR